MPTRRRRRGLAAALGLLVSASALRAQLILDDPLTGSTRGTRSGGQFTAGGWKVTGTNDFIYWHVPTLTGGAVEFDVRGLNPGECRPDHEDKNELFHMYDHTFGHSDVNYHGGYRDNPYKHFIRKTNCLDRAGVDSMELVWKILDHYEEPDTARLSWDPRAVYRFREEWEPAGAHTVCRVYRDGVLLRTMSQPGLWNPAGHSIRIGASPRAPLTGDFGAPLDAVFSNVKVYATPPAVPGAPTILQPTAGETVNTLIAFIAWTGDTHNRFQVQVNTVNRPDAGVAWNSGPVTSADGFTWTGALPGNGAYYAFVRLSRGGAFGPWSAGRPFVVDSAFIPPGPDVVSLKGRSMVRKTGPFNGLGVTYMQALRRCKYDRARYRDDLAFLASRGFQYIRMLTMVGWNAAWQGREIAPVAFANQNGVSVAAWPDYWRQFRDCIDIAYDGYGLRSEITIFADAQLMPGKADRIHHMQTLLDNLVGREHKVMHLEVANEAWQNGFPGEQGVADLREFCTYLTDRTSIPVAISSPPDTSDAGITALYAGSTADLATVHFDRDISALEGGWRPVRDTYRTGLSGVPPVSSNEPIGPGSSVNTESDPIKLVMAAAFAWGAGLPLYVYHTDAGVFGKTTFQSRPAVGDFRRLKDLLPPDLAGWARNDGREPAAAFTTFSNGQPNKWWPEVSASASGAVRHTGAIKGGEFVTFPIGIQGGLEIEARRPMQFAAYHPLTGAVVAGHALSAGQRVTLPTGPGAYILKGVFTDVASSLSELRIDLGSANVYAGLTHPQGGDGDTTAVQVGGREARRNLNPAEDFYFYFAVMDGFAFQGDKPDLYVSIAYYDGGTGSLSLQFDGATNPYQSGGGVALTGAPVWKHHTWHLAQAYFGNRQNGGADLRIGNVGNPFHIDVVRVSTRPPLPPATAPVAPNPTP
ncbi:MAG: hypothetical protein HRF43_10725 [Phycisphaerae bacterium]